MNILVDGMGGDNSPHEIVKGAVMAAKEIDETISIIGPVVRIGELLSEQGYMLDDSIDESSMGYLTYKAQDACDIRVINATEVITNNEAPAMAVRKKKDSTIVKGVSLVKEGSADAFISAGSTGALLAAGLLNLGRIKGVKRPGIAAFFPKIGKDDNLLILDVGASVDPKPEYLLQYGIMGSIFVQCIKGIDDPSVMMLNVGAEAEKGDEVHKIAYEMLEKSSINFQGNVEGRDVPSGPCDVVVTDGFAGNIFVKTAEGIAMGVMNRVKDKMMESTKSKIGALLAKDKLYEIKDEFDYSGEGGSPILGLNGPILKIHGSSVATGVKNAIVKAVPYVSYNITEKIAEAIISNEELQKSGEL